MMAKTSDEALAPWWTAEKCHNHQPYPTRNAAARAAERHPFAIVRCPKCRNGRAPEVFRCHSDRSHWHWGHGVEFAHEDATPLPTPTPVLVGKGRPRLTDEQARDIWQMRQDGRPRNEVAALFGLPRQTIHDIELGRSYRRALAGLAGAPTTRRERMTLVTAQLRQMQGEETTMPVQPKPITIEAEMDNVRGRVAAVLLPEMADALETLLDLRDRPLPKFVTLDVDAIRDYIKQARAAVAS